MPAPGTRFITSGMRRCNETLEALFGTVPYEIEPDFREIDFGDFEMKSYEMLKDDPAYQAWLTGDNEKNVPPNGESGGAYDSRRFLPPSRVQEAGRDAVIVTHGGVIAAIMAHLFPEGKTATSGKVRTAEVGDRRRGIYAVFSSVDRQKAVERAAFLPV